MLNLGVQPTGIWKQ